MNVLPLSPLREPHFLPAGEVLCAQRPLQVSAVLGSCVAVCLWDARLRVGGLNHFMLPSLPAGAPPSARYGDVALQELLMRLAALGALPPRLQAHVVGGAHVVPALEHSRHLAAENVDLALHVLAALRIPVVSRETGGTRGRQLLFQTDDGLVRVRSF